MCRLIIFIVPTILTLSACSTPVGVRETGFEPVYRSLSTNVLDDGKPSTTSLQVLAHVGLDERYRDHPAEAIDEFEAKFQVERLREFQVVLAELHYALALREKSRERFLVSAIYAYIYLFDEKLTPLPNHYSPSFRLACDLYNRSLARALLNSDGEVEVLSRDVETSLGQI